MICAFANRQDKKTGSPCRFHFSVLGMIQSLDITSLTPGTAFLELASVA